MHISLTVTHKDPAMTRVVGYTHLWAVYVRGFRPEVHCQDCFIGRRSEHLRHDKTMLGVTYDFDETENFNQLYICGFAAGPKNERGGRNLHFPLLVAEGESCEKTTLNGFTFRATNARELSIPEPLEALNHLGEEHYRCKNFRFGVEYYGYPWPAPSAG